MPCLGPDPQVFERLFRAAEDRPQHTDRNLCRVVIDHIEGLAAVERIEPALHHLGHQSLRRRRALEESLGDDAAHAGVVGVLKRQHGIVRAELGLDRLVETQDIGDDRIVRRRVLEIARQLAVEQRLAAQGIGADHQGRDHAVALDRALLALRIEQGMRVFTQARIQFRVFEQQEAGGRR